MNRSTVSTIAVTTLLLGSGVSALLFVKPALEEQNKLKTEKATLESQKTSLQAQLADLEARVKRQAMGTISYFDLRESSQQRREMETKTVETLASLTEILNDNRIDVQALEPKGETNGMSKPVPSAAPSGDAPVPGASGAPSAAPVVPGMAGAPSAAPSTGEIPVQLTHKVFRFLVRGEYPNLVRAMAEIQALPRAISVNQFEVDLVRKPGDPKDTSTPDPNKPIVTDSTLELDFQLSITYLMAGGVPAGAVPPSQAPGTPVSVLPALPLAGADVPVSVQLMQWATSFLGAPAFAAEAPRARFEVVGLGADGRDLVLRMRRGVPPFRMTGEARRVVLELINTEVAATAGMTGQVPGVRSIVVRPVAGRASSSELVIETDGARFRPQIDAAGRLRLHRVEPAPSVAAQPLVGKVPLKPRVLYAAPAAPAAKGAQSLASRLVAGSPSQLGADAARQAYFEQIKAPEVAPKHLEGDRPAMVGGASPALEVPKAAPGTVVVRAAKAGTAAPLSSYAAGDDLFDLARTFGSATEIAEAPVAEVHELAAPAAAETPAPSAKGRGGKATKGEASTQMGTATRRDTANAETWSRLAQQAAHETSAADRFHSPLATEAADEATPIPARGTPVRVPAPVHAAVEAPAPARPMRPAAPPVLPQPATKAAAQPAIEPPVTGRRAMIGSTPTPQAPASPRAVVGYKDMVGQPAPASAPARPSVGHGRRSLADLARRAVRQPAASLAASTGPATLLGVAHEHGALVVRTDGPAPTFRVLGGNKQSIVVELADTRLPGSGRQFDVHRGGVERVRAVLYDNNPPRVRLSVDTDGTVAVHPLVGPDGVLRFRLAPRGVQAFEQRLASAATSVIITTGKENPITRDPGSAHPRPLRPTPPVVKAPAKPKPRLVHVTRPTLQRRIVRVPGYGLAHTGRPAHHAASRPLAPSATPTPMASPHSPRTRPTGGPSASPGAKGSPQPGATTTPSPTPTPVFVPTPMPTQLPTPPGPSLGRSLTSNYAFPIDRDKLTGRKNPFKPIAKRIAGVPGAPGSAPVAVPGAPRPIGLPPGAPGVPKAPTTPAKPKQIKSAALSGGVYVLGGILTGGGQPPMALITIDGKGYTVGLNETLPGNATVTAIRADHVILTADGRQVPLYIKR